MTIVSRFAPSPTGFLHIGGARTALFSWLLARHAGGKFLLRIEDTDRERSTQAAVDAILEAMDWLGLEYDGEALYQSHREARHNEVIDELVARGEAYWCECTAEEVEAMRERARAEGRKPKYDGRCRERGLGAGAGRVVRLKTPPTGTIAYRDMVKGPIAVEAQELDDMILRRSDGTPTYNLAVVVDDHDMGVTHVLRGDDHVNNTPRQILIYRAMGWAVPEFGHVPMILGPDKKKLSKRHGALSVTEYQDMGYLPEAVMNYLARLGWSHGDQEVFSKQELIELFDTANLGSSPSVFDLQKLDWLNGQYIQKADPADIAARVLPILKAQWGEARYASADAGRIAAAVPLLMPRAKTLVEMAPQLEPFAWGAAELAYDAEAVAKHLTPEARALLGEYRALLAGAEVFAEGPLEEAAKVFLEQKGLKFKALAQPIRVAVTGRTASPGLFETMVVLGRDETLARLDRALGLP